MSTQQPRMIFVNLAVSDLQRSIDFFTKLGFAFNPTFTDERAACMIINEHAYVMLLQEAFFAGFTKLELCDTKRSTEVLCAVSCPSREAVDEMVARAIAAGGTHAMDKIDHGFMYGWSFYDPDGHHWEPNWMDPAAMQNGPPSA